MSTDENKTSHSTIIAIVSLILAIVAFIFGDNLYQQITGNSFFAPDIPVTSQPVSNAQVTPITINANTKSVARLIIPANSNQGITFAIPESGVYNFQYSDSVANIQGNTDPNSGGWYTSVNCFRGDTAIWDEATKNKIFYFGVGSYKIYNSRDEAIKESIGGKASENFIAGENVTCVLADGYDKFSDNNGEVILDVFVLP